MKKNKSKQLYVALPFIIIPILIMLVFVFIPMFYSLVLTLYERKSLSGEMIWNDFDNFKRIFGSGRESRILIALSNTVKFSLVVVPLQTFIALLMAYVLNSKIKFQKGFRIIFFLPTLTSSAALVLIFKYLFSIDGPATELLVNIGYLSEGKNLLEDSTFALKIIMMMNIWSTVPFFMTIYLAGLQSIPKDVYEAAEIDGAGSVRKFLNITVPLLKPITFFVLLTGVIGTLQMFDQAFIFSGGDGGPSNSTLTITLLIYEYGFTPGRNGQGFAATLALGLAVFIFIISFVVSKLNGGVERYER